MEAGNAFGGQKAGAPFDPITFVQRPQVFLRALCWVRQKFNVCLFVRHEKSIAMNLLMPTFRSQIHT